VDAAGVTYADLLAALEQATQLPGREPNVFIRRDVERWFDKSERAAMYLIKKLRRGGLIVPVWVQVIDEWDIRRRVQGYRVVKPVGEG